MLPLFPELLPFFPTGVFPPPIQYLASTLKFTRQEEGFTAGNLAIKFAARLPSSRRELVKAPRSSLA